MKYFATCDSMRLSMLSAFLINREIPFEFSRYLMIEDINKKKFKELERFCRHNGIELDEKIEVDKILPGDWFKHIFVTISTDRSEDSEVIWEQDKMEIVNNEERYYGFCRISKFNLFKKGERSFERKEEGKKCLPVSKRDLIKMIMEKSRYEKILDL